MILAALIAASLAQTSPEFRPRLFRSDAPARLSRAADVGGAGSSPLLTNLERYYAFDGDGVDKANAQDATALNANTNYASGIIGQSAGVNNDANAGFHAPSLNLMGDMTISFWVHTMSGGGAGYCPAVGQMIGGGGVNINYAVFQGGTLQVYETGNYASVQATISTGSWQHTVYVRDVGAGTWSSYVNGAFQASSPSVGPYSLPSSYLQIMHRDDLYSSFGTWRLDELGIWSRKLTLAEIQALYNSGAGKAYPFL